MNFKKRFNLEEKIAYQHRCIAWLNLSTVLWGGSQYYDTSKVNEASLGEYSQECIVKYLSNPENSDLLNCFQMDMDRLSAFKDPSILLIFSSVLFVVSVIFLVFFWYFYWTDILSKKMRREKDKDGIFEYYRKWIIDYYTKDYYDKGLSLLVGDNKRINEDEMIDYMIKYQSGKTDELEKLKKIEGWEQIEDHIKNLQKAFGENIAYNTGNIDTKWNMLRSKFNLSNLIDLQSEAEKEQLEWFKRTRKKSEEKIMKKMIAKFKSEGRDFKNKEDSELEAIIRDNNEYAFEYAFESMAEQKRTLMKDENLGISFLENIKDACESFDAYFSEKKLSVFANNVASSLWTVNISLNILKYSLFLSGVSFVLLSGVSFTTVYCLNTTLSNLHMDFIHHLRMIKAHGAINISNASILNASNVLRASAIDVSPEEVQWALQVGSGVLYFAIGCFFLSFLSFLIGRSFAKKIVLFNDSFAAVDDMKIIEEPIFNKPMWSLFHLDVEQKIKKNKKGNESSAGTEKNDDIFQKKAVVVRNWDGIGLIISEVLLFTFLVKNFLDIKTNLRTLSALFTLLEIDRAKNKLDANSENFFSQFHDAVVAILKKKYPNLA